MLSRPRCWMNCVGLLGLLLGTVCPADEPARAEPVFDDASIEFFEKEVRPILTARCLECHGNGEKAPKGGLRLNSRSELIKGGDTGAAIVPGKPAESLLVSAINYGDVYQMPPKSKLPPKEIATLTKWVEMGAPWPKEAASVGKVKPFDLAARRDEHWCWQAIKDHAPPAVKDSAWPATVVDRFILAKLEAKSLKPSPQADKLVLLRRVYFDLVGLPPSVEEIEAFLKDESLQALEHVVDRLLGSVHFGERWGRHWLDLVRYAETRGHEFEPIIPNAWQYRDYVIRALNADVPYNRLLTEHIAGDLIEPRWREVDGRGLKVDGQTKPAADLQPSTINHQPRINESILGTGFWFLGEEVHSPVDIRKDETDRMDNRLDVLSKTFLGLTVACARCHDHKFDAISQRDYYALAGFAISGSYRQVRVDTHEQHREIADKLAEIHALQRIKVAGSLIEAARPTLDKLDQYLLAAQQALTDGTALEPAEDKRKRLTPAAREKVNALAAAKQLDAELLARWTVELEAARTDKQHPLHGITLPVADAAGLGESISPAANDPNKTKQAPAGSPGYEGLVVDFVNLHEERFLQDGVSFGTRPVPPGWFEMRGPADRREFSVATIGGWERDLFWKDIKLAPGVEDDHGKLGEWHRHGRMVRSPEFTLTKGTLWYLVRGSVRAYAAVNSHLVLAGPLHGAVVREFKHDKPNEWRWVAHPLDGYRDHRMHVEFTPGDDAECTIAMVVQRDDSPPLPIVSWRWMDEFVRPGMPPEERAKSYREAISGAATSIVLGEIFSPASDQQREMNGAWAEVANWFVRRCDLFVKDWQPPKLDTAEEAELAKTVQWESHLAPTVLDGNGINEQLLIRGNSNTPRESVPRRFLEACGAVERRETRDKRQPENDVSSRSTDTATLALDSPLSTLDSSGSGRKQLTYDMLKSPLAARVAVNRVWHHLFGRGIVPTVDNFGVLGQPPSHPELLDHLATRFVKEGWSQKKLIKSLILSRTYQMSSKPDPAAEAADPDNVVWHRMPIKRLEGEVIRDSLLAVSGRLDRKPFGPSVAIHLTPFMQGRGRPGNSGPVDGDGRRSIYISVRRNFLSPMMLAFDTPSPFSTVGRRTVSNVPAQALILMNDPLVIEQAKRWADRTLADASQTPEQRIESLYLTVFARRPTDREKLEAWSFLVSYPGSPPDAKSDPNKAPRDAWTDLCHVLFNVKEFIYVE
ncbi:MAG: PSD1 and planctomycete cytochrome C domain-containing protein [Planctomycetota bacterium]